MRWAAGAVVVEYILEGLADTGTTGLMVSQVKRRPTGRINFKCMSGSRLASLLYTLCISLVTRVVGGGWVVGP